MTRVTRIQIINISLLLLFSLLFYSIPYLNHNYNAPIGWDTPSYIWQSKLLEANGVSSLVQTINSFRIGYATLSTIVHLLTGIDNIRVEMILPLFLGYILALSFANFAYSYKKSLALFNFVFLLTIGSFGTIRIIQDLHANLIALLFASFTLYFISKNNNRIECKYLFLTILFLFLTGISHEFTYLLLVAVIFLFSLMELVRYVMVNLIKNSFNLINSSFFILWLVILISGLLVFFCWKDVLFTALRVAESQISFSSNTSSVSSSLESNLKFLKMWYPHYHIKEKLLFIVIGILELFLLKFYKKNLLTTEIIISWLLVTSFLSIGFLYGLSFPYYRTLLLVPFPILIGIGLQRIFYLSKGVDHLKICRYISLIIVLLVVSLNLSYTYNYWDSRPVWISNEAIEQLSLVSNYIQHNKNTNTPIIFIIIPGYDPGSLCLLWYDWIRAFMPKEYITDTYIYFGNTVYYLSSSPTIKGNNNYDSISISSYNALPKKNVSNAQIFILSAFNRHDYSTLHNTSLVKKVASGVLLLDPNIKGNEKMTVAINVRHPSKVLGKWWYSGNKYPEVYDTNFKGNASNVMVEYTFFIPKDTDVKIKIEYTDWNPFVAPFYIKIDEYKYKVEYTNGIKDQEKHITRHLDKGLHKIAFVAAGGSSTIHIRIKQIEVSWDYR